MSSIRSALVDILTPSNDASEAQEELGIEPIIPLPDGEVIEVHLDAKAIEAVRTQLADTEAERDDIQAENEELREANADLTRALGALSRATDDSHGARGADQPERRSNVDASELYAAIERVVARKRLRDGIARRVAKTFGSGDAARTGDDGK